MKNRFRSCQNQSEIVKIRTLEPSWAGLGPIWASKGRKRPQKAEKWNPEPPQNRPEPGLLGFKIDQNRTKLGPNWWKSGFKIGCFLRSLFESIFHRFWVDFGPGNHQFFLHFGIPNRLQADIQEHDGWMAQIYVSYHSGTNLKRSGGSKIGIKCIKNRSKIDEKVDQNKHRIWMSILNQF